MKVVALHRYAAKSMGGEVLTRAEIEPRGLVGDRRWMMVSDSGRFLTRRDLPAMALLHARPGEGGLDLSHQDGTRLAVPVPHDGASLAVRVWDDHLEARDAGDAVAQWLSAHVGRAVRLVHMHDDLRRPVDPAWGQAGDEVSFADGFPILLTTLESLDALNARLSAPIPMARFRPNLVIEGAPAFAEHGWRALRIGALRLRLVKPCTRCVVVTQDVASGAVVEPMEPLRTLRAMGQVMPGKPHEPIFGQNAIPDGPGTIALGDRVEVLSE